MRHRLVGSPWWVLSLVFGTIYVVALIVYARLTGMDEGAAGSVIGPVVSGVPFGLVMGWTTARANRRAATAAGLDDLHELPAVSRAADRGPAPTDPRLRAAARNLAGDRLEQFRSQRAVTLIVLVFATLGSVAAAIFSSPRAALGTALFASLLVQNLALPSRLERRITLLSDDH